MDSNNVIEAWLRSKGCTLWMNWDLTQPDEMAQAVAWFQNEMASLNSFHSKQIARKWAPNVEFDVV